ncbi:hypothetical protein T10_11058 [Trichinella papuae]|uniref:Uncharacterized protein n=1 Tax=Trichinella papuae TaxID=268474 RepID=A0A0V1MNM3_9BILA|nr:hypothetical protein T10_11058 [Trichinella papuae]
MKSNFVLSADNFAFLSYHKSILILFDGDDLLNQPCNGSVVLSKDVNVKLSSGKYAVKLLVPNKKVKLNAKRRTDYVEQFNIFEGNFGMSLVHQIQPKHSECRKLVKKFHKFDKTLKSLLAYGKKSQILYTISDVDLNLFDSKSSPLPSHKHIREGK